MDAVTASRAIALALAAGALACNGVTLVAIDGGQDGGDAAPLGEGGSSGGGAGDAATCPQGSVTFVLGAAPASATGYCLGAPGSCSSEWLSIRAADGGAIGIDAPCLARCSQCQAVACSNLCAAPSPLGPSGAMRTWDGTSFPSSTCGSPPMPCVDTACAPAGAYVATMCGYATTADASLLPGCASGAMTPTCTDIPFDWPPPGGTATVNGTIGGDGG